jgi:hypothetical protein
VIDNFGVSRHVGDEALDQATPCGVRRRDRSTFDGEDRLGRNFQRLVLGTLDERQDPERHSFPGGWVVLLPPVARHDPLTRPVDVRGFVAGCAPVFRSTQSDKARPVANSVSAARFRRRRAGRASRIALTAVMRCAMNSTSAATMWASVRAEPFGTVPCSSPTSKVTEVR